MPIHLYFFSSQLGLNVKIYSNLHSIFISSLIYNEALVFCTLIILPFSIFNFYTSIFMYLSCRQVKNILSKQILSFFSYNLHPCLYFWIPIFLSFISSLRPSSGSTKILSSSIFMFLSKFIRPIIILFTFFLWNVLIYIYVSIPVYISIITNHWNPFLSFHNL